MKVKNKMFQYIAENEDLKVLTASDCASNGIAEISKRIESTGVMLASRELPTVKK